MKNAARCRHPDRPHWSAGHASCSPHTHTRQPLATSRSSATCPGPRAARKETRTTAPLRPTTDRGSGAITALPTGFWRQLPKATHPISKCQPRIKYVARRESHTERASAVDISRAPRDATRGNTGECSNVQASCGRGAACGATGDFEIDSGGMCPFVVNIVLPEAVVDRIAGWEELRPCR
jgi:hypothetical protein